MKTIAALAGMALFVAATPSIAATGDAPETSAATLQPSDWTWNDTGTQGALSVVVSLPDQRAYVYRGDTMIAVSSVSTGRDGKETPTGTFPILQKQVSHKSNLYNAAAMPYMERLTWDGVAIHAGETPGIPTSHGCVHVPAGFAKKLYAATRIGTVVSVTDSSIVPTDPSMLPPDPLIDSEQTADANAAMLSDVRQW